MPREFTRSDRVASQFQRELAELMRIEIRDPRLGMVTLSDVEITRDMSLAKAYVSFLGAGETPNRCVKILAESAPKLRHALGKRIRLRVMPDLRFVYDDSIERGSNMDRLLSSLGSDEGEDQEAAESP
ncbi:MAG: 30S ribosome-binding factor RbfA [Methylococcaceae bacterium]|nr:30S ribosome-binding factor RbfA [Methylococcaceae bacterium]